MHACMQLSLAEQIMRRTTALRRQCSFTGGKREDRGRRDRERKRGGPDRSRVGGCMSSADCRWPQCNVQRASRSSEYQTTTVLCPPAYSMYASVARRRGRSRSHCGRGHSVHAYGDHMRWGLEVVCFCVCAFVRAHACAQEKVRNYKTLFRRERESLAKSTPSQKKKKTTWWFLYVII